MENFESISGKEFLEIVKQFVVENNCKIRKPIVYLMEYNSNYVEWKAPEDIAKFWKKYGNTIRGVNYTDSELEEFQKDIE